MTFPPAAPPGGMADTPPPADAREATSRDLAARVFLQYLRRTPAGPATQNRLAQAQHFTGVAYLAIRTIYDALAGCTVTATCKTDRPRTKAMPTPGNLPDDDRRTPVAGDHPLAELFQEINAQDTLADLLADWVIQQELTGVFHLWAAPNAFGLPVELWGLPSALTNYQPASPAYPRGAYLVNWYGAGAPGGGQGFGGTAFLPGEEVLASKLRHPLWRWDGYSPLSAGAQQMDVLEAIDESRKAAMEQGTTPDMLIAIDGATPQQCRDVDRDIQAQYAGPRNARRPLVVDGAKVDAKMLATSAKDMDYATGWKDMTGFALSLFNVPEAVIMSSSSSYSQLYASLRQFHTFNLRPRVHRYAEFLNKHLVRPNWGPGYAVQFDLPTLDDPDLLERQIGADKGVMTVNEHRALRQKPPWPDGDVPAFEFEARRGAKVQAETAPPSGPAGTPPPTRGPGAGRPGQSDPAAAGSKGPRIKSLARFLDSELARAGRR